MAYKVIILYRLYMPSYFLGTFTEYPQKNISDFFRFNYTSNRSYRKLNTRFIPKGNYDFF